jgi:hypothetical protein
MKAGRELQAGAWRLVALSLVIALMASKIAFAQASGDTYEIGGGLRFVGPESLGRVDANESNPGGGDFRLFSADSSLGALVGLEARFGVRVMPTLRLEATGSYGASDLSVKLDMDAEGAASLTASERVTQFALEGAAVMEPTRWRFARGTPFLSAGGGYVRALHEERILVEDGALWFAGGGLNLLLRPVGLRFDARARFQRGIIADGVHITPVFGATAFLRF